MTKQPPGPFSFRIRETESYVAELGRAVDDGAEGVAVHVDYVVGEDDAEGGGEVVFGCEDGVGGVQSGRGGEGVAGARIGGRGGGERKEVDAVG